MGTRSIPAPELKEELEAAKVKQLGRALKPWEREWNPMRQVPTPLPPQVPPVTRWFLLFAVPLAFDRAVGASGPLDSCWIR